MSASDIIKDTIQIDLTAPFPFNINTLMTHIIFYAIGITLIIGCVFLSILMIKAIIRQFKKGA